MTSNSILCVPRSGVGLRPFVFAPKPSSKEKVPEEVPFHFLAGACMEAFLET
jgi:hypothetical protein